MDLHSFFYIVTNAPEKSKETICAEVKTGVHTLNRLRRI